MTQETISKQQLYQGFLSDILTNKEDNTPRLIFCDWLEEFGDEDDRNRAEYIRLSIERDTLNLKTYPKHRKHCTCRYCVISRRLIELGKGKVDIYGFPTLYPPAKKWIGPPLVDIPGTHYLITRGFVSHVWIETTYWFSSGDELLRQHPIEKVELTFWREGHDDQLEQILLLKKGLPAKFGESMSDDYKRLTLLKLIWRGIDFDIVLDNNLPSWEK